MAKKGGGRIGRPIAIKVSADQFEVLANALKQAAIFLADTAKFCRENDLEEGFVIPAAKVFDEYSPAIEYFARKAFAECGPAATAKRLGRKTPREINAEKYSRRRVK